MGNKNVKEFDRKSGYPFNVHLTKINTKPDLESVKFEPSAFNMRGQEKYEVKPMPMDKEIRNSQFCMVQCPQLSSKSQNVIKEYFVEHDPNYEYQNPNGKWRLTRYNEGGHFVEHFDRQKQSEEFIHFGTEIYLPPKSLFDYEGGELVLKSSHEMAEISADQQKWTHIILPLGIAHSVKKVTKGSRLSYVRQIWVKQKENFEKIETDQDRKIREQQELIEQERYRQHMAQREREMRQGRERLMRNRRNLPPGFCD